MIIAEVAQAHDGSLGTAHAYIDAVASAGADAVKFQTHIAREESTTNEPWRISFSPQDKSRLDYWERTSFTESQWRGLAKHAEDRGLIFLSTPFSFAAVDLLERVRVRAWKVASGEVTNLPLIDYMARTGKPVLISSGMSSWGHITAAVQTVRKHGSPVAVLQCTTAYPCPPEQIGLNVLHEIRERYACRVGLSDHSGTIYPGIVAAALGANLLEVHVVFSRACFGPDTPASITIDELNALVHGVRFSETMRSHPVNKDMLAGELAGLRQVFEHSLVAARDLVAGHRLSREDIALKKPGTGVAAGRLPEFIGRVLRNGLRADALIREEDVDHSSN